MAQAPVAHHLSSRGLDAATGRLPDVFVELGLESDRQSVGQDPSGQLLGTQLVVDRREEHGEPFGQPVLGRLRGRLSGLR